MPAINFADSPWGNAIKTNSHSLILATSVDANFCPLKVLNCGCTLVISSPAFEPAAMYTISNFG